MQVAGVTSDEGRGRARRAKGGGRRLREAVGYEGKAVDCVSEARCGAGRDLGACLLAGLIGSKAGDLTCGMAASGMSDDSGAGEDTGSSARTADEDGCEKGALAGALPLGTRAAGWPRCLRWR